MKSHRRNNRRCSRFKYTRINSKELHFKFNGKRYLFIFIHNIGDRTERLSYTEVRLRSDIVMHRL